MPFRRDGLRCRPTSTAGIGPRYEPLGIVGGSSLGAILAVPTLSIILAIIGYYRSEDPEVVEAAARGNDEKPEPLRTAAG